MPDHKLTQRFLNFDDPTAPVPFTPPPPLPPVKVSWHARLRLERLAEWLTDPRTGRPFTELGAEVLKSLRKVLLEGKNGYVQHAEDLLELLSRRNGKTTGEDIPPVPVPVSDDFRRAVEEVLDVLAERVTARGR